MTQATILILFLGLPFWGGQAAAQTSPQSSPQSSAQSSPQKSPQKLGQKSGQSLFESDQKHYQQCMAQARIHPAKALNDANTWRGAGGGLPSRHCRLAPLMKLGRYGEAAEGFAKLAKDVEKDLNLKIRLYIQGANAWFVAGQPEQAEKMSALILGLDPENSNALLIKAKAFGMLGKFWDAAEQLTRLLYAEPNNTNILILRGSAYRQMGAKDLALTDFDRVISLDANNVEALLERGLIHFQNKNLQKARQDWQALVKMNPDDPIRQFAEKYLQKLDAAQKN
ncbi:MAG: tetratricopeptide repeat protein [Magnetovibrio sp.]|nr:tetratricopeptide repeat protein [Magnetovibrio sp.]